MRYLGCWVIEVLIRDFQLADIDEIVEILKLNSQYGYPRVDGPEAMKRVRACEAAVFLVCEMEGKAVGLLGVIMTAQERWFISSLFIRIAKGGASEPLL